MPLRLQWNENNGYCGECSLISDGLVYGQYFSQYDMRMISDLRDNNKSQTTSQLLLGVNDVYAANNVKLNNKQWENKIRNTEQFLVWIKEQVSLGNLVTIGVYTNEYLFYGLTNPTAGDPDYDHIVSVTKITSKHNDTTKYYEDDIITFSDHGLWSPVITGPKYLFEYTFKEFQGNRVNANTKNGNIYTLPNSTNIGNYGISIYGPMDENNELIKVNITTNLNYEEPEIKRNSNVRPTPMELEIIIRISEIEPNVIYNLYQYNDENNVPISNFNSNSKSLAYKKYSIKTTNNNYYSFSLSILSSDKVIFRCVKSTDP